MSTSPSHNTRRVETPDFREGVFARVREALRLTAPRRQFRSPSAGADSSTAESTAFSARKGMQAWLPRVSLDRREQLTQFRNHAAELTAQVIVVKSHYEIVTHFKAVILAQRWQRIATHPGSLAESFAHQMGLPILTVGPGYQILDLEASDAAFTDCDALVAQTGSVLVTNTSAGGRALSVLPRHHVVFARLNQLVPDLTAALKMVQTKYAEEWPSFISFITGPSRTCDIERTLVIGAHGPKFLTIVIYDK